MTGEPAGGGPRRDPSGAGAAAEYDEAARLRALFVELPRPPAPRFTLPARPRRRRPVTRWLPAVAAAVLVLALGWVLTGPLRVSTSEGGGELELARSLSGSLLGWEAPLDFLLEVPGEELLDEVPDLAPGAAIDWAAPDWLGGHDGKES